MNEVADNLDRIKQDLPDHIKLIAISKTQAVDRIQEAYNAGHKMFGENKVQELTDKHKELPGDIEWHMVGHLQTNKVKYIAPFVNMIHSVDRFKVLKTINKEALKNQRVIPCLLQIHIASEESKFGLSREEAIEILESDAFKNLQNIRIDGLMGMTTFTDDTGLIRKEFRQLKGLFQEIKENYFQNQDTFREISMGMSSDYKIATEEGSTMVRIGSSIFGARNYQ